MEIPKHQTGLIFDAETAKGLYRIFAGLSSSCYLHAEVYDSAKPAMKAAFEKVIKWGKENKIGCRGDE